MASPLNLVVIDNSKIKNYSSISGKAVKSIFGNSQFSPFPESFNAETGSVNKAKISKEQIHNDDIYNISIDEIVKHCKQYPGSYLDYSDFAYLKDVGVYPNNRLIIARRFPSGVSNDLTAIRSYPQSTLISWAKDGDDYISVSYNEEWTDAEASFTDVLNDVGEEFRLKGVGNEASKSFTVVPLPGFTEGLQYEVFRKMGLSDRSIGDSPNGNPNMIRQAKRRTTLDKGKPGSGLSAKFSIKMTVEYEQKFIAGVDPTLVYMDIIQNALTFGTSDSVFNFSNAFATGTNGIIGQLISGDIVQIGLALKSFVTNLLDAIGSIGKDLIKNLIDPPKNDNEKPDVDKLFSEIKNAFASTIGHVISKYKIRLIGVANSLTGSPSAPWHVTIGNPKRPIFSSGDMICESVNLTLGKNLSFNDLPSYIKIEFTLSNARNLGAQEIFNRFNTGRGRSYVRLNPSFVEKGDYEITGSTYSAGATVSSGTNVTVKNKQDDYLIYTDDRKATGTGKSKK